MKLYEYVLVQKSKIYYKNYGKNNWEDSHVEKNYDMSLVVLYY